MASRADMDREFLLEGCDETIVKRASRGNLLQLKSDHSKIYALRFCLVLSLGLNVLWATSFAIGKFGPHEEPMSLYASLARDRQEPYVLETPYTSPNETLQAQLWHDINIDAGMVALSDSWADAHEIRIAQRFPWDHSKGLYLLHGYHNLHCVKIIYNSLHEYRTSKAQSRNWHHVIHCLDGLRRQILCDADDTPRATDRRAEVVTGVGQYRKCRRWEALEEFAQRHTACYRRPERPEDEPRIIERFKHCPNGSEYVIQEDYTPVDPLLSGLPEDSRLQVP